MTNIMIVKVTERERAEEIERKLIRKKEQTQTEKEPLDKAYKEKRQAHQTVKKIIIKTKIKLRTSLSVIINFYNPSAHIS